MTDENSKTKNITSQDLPKMDVEVASQYIKDLSFENPHQSKFLGKKLDSPKFDVNANVNVNHVREKLYEVELQINASAKFGEDTGFILELTYAGLLAIKEMDENMLYPFLMIEGPRLLFPFARKIVAETTLEGGYPPLALNPIDFVDLFRQRMEKMQEEAKGTS